MSIDFDVFRAAPILAPIVWLLVQAAKSYILDDTWETRVLPLLSLAFGVALAALGALSEWREAWGLSWDHPGGVILSGLAAGALASYGHDLTKTLAGRG